MKHVVAAILAAIPLAAPAEIVVPPRDSGLAVTNTIPLRPARIILNMSRDSLSDALPTGFYFARLSDAARRRCHPTVTGAAPRAGMRKPQPRRPHTSAPS